MPALKPGGQSKTGQAGEDGNPATGALVEPLLACS